ncbi:MAG: hypothetical protein INQ03_06620 [Candidatus Heimdallarchaeota archaeon]|nr:hypothetical protein [Candidatus Heimdallarchaeota archaeon]
MHEKNYIEKNNQTAELIGFILGDGSLSSQQLIMTFNSAEKNTIGNHVENLISSLFHLKPSVIYKKDCNAYHIYTSKQAISNELVRLGLTTGNKVKNQVSVPNWIKRNNLFSKYCMLGLFDSDGSIFWVKRNNNTRYVGISFSNRSMPLLDFFEDFCFESDISFSRGPDSINIRAMKSVAKFAKIFNVSFKIKKFLNLNNLSLLDLSISHPIDDN